MGLLEGDTSLPVQTASKAAFVLNGDTIFSKAACLEKIGWNKG